LPHDWKWCSFVIIPFDDLKEVHSQDFEHGNEMLSMRSVVKEAIEKLDTVRIVASDILKLLRFLAIVSFEGVKPLLFHPVRRALI
jgi:hypothetical protein